MTFKIFDYRFPYSTDKHEIGTVNGEGLLITNHLNQSNQFWPMNNESVSPIVASVQCRLNTGANPISLLQTTP
jgi:hypothetical protein